MKRFALVLLALLVTATAHAQQPFSTQSLTAMSAGAACPDAGCMIVDVQGLASAGVQITGTWTQTLQFEQSIDKATWATWSVTSNAGGAAVTSTTGNGLWFGSLAGARWIRVRVSAFTSGTAVVSMQAAQARIYQNVPGSFSTLFTDSVVIDRANRDIFLYRTAAKTLNIDTDGAGGLLTQINLTGAVLVSGVFAPQSSINGAAAISYAWNGRAAMSSPADKQVKIVDSGGTTGIEVNVGTPTLGTCTGGAIVSGSHNFAGSYTGNTSGSCIINFGTPNFTNAPFCFAMSLASTTHPRISAASASSITVTGGVSGEQINYHCDGRIGT